MVCPYCKANQSDGAQFCTNCGGKFEIVSQPQYQQSVNAPYTSSQMTYQPVGGYMPAEPEKPVSLGAWIGWILLCTLLPVIGPIIVLCTAKNETIKNWAKATLILAVIGAVLTVLLSIAVAALGFSIADYGMDFLRLGLASFL